MLMSIPALIEPGRAYPITLTLQVRLPGREPHLHKHTCRVHATKYIHARNDPDHRNQVLQILGAQRMDVPPNVC
jgi:hypothetical protein